jgi:hypothetical protein
MAREGSFDFRFDEMRLWNCKDEFDGCWYLGEVDLIVGFVIFGLKWLKRGTG